jgi:uncharacterized protein (TIGR04222 family)
MLALAIISLVAVFATVTLARVARRESLQAPEGTGERVLDVPDLAYLAGGPVRATLCALAALVRERVIHVADQGAATLAMAVPPSRPADKRRAVAVDTMNAHGSSMPLRRLWDKMLKGQAMGESATRLRRRHLLLPADWRPSAWPCALIALATALGVVALAWSAAKGQLAGAVIAGLATIAGAAGWRSTSAEA